MPSRPRQKTVCDFDAARHIGILFTTADADWKQEMSSFLNFLRTKRIRYTAMGFLAQRNISEDDCLSVCQYFSSKDLTWMRTPKQNTLVRQFMMQQFDMLIDSASADNEILNYIMTASPASFKIGSRHGSMKDSPCDLLLDLPDRNGIRPFFDIVKDYVPMFGSNNSLSDKNTI